jgi:hypothetical protein
MPVVPFSSSLLLLLRSRTQGGRDMDQALYWLREWASLDAMQLLWQQLWLRYGKSSNTLLPLSNEFLSEAERVLKSGELVPVFHPLPVVAATVISSAPTARPDAASPRPLPPPPEPSTFNPEHATAAQVRALRDAAQTGVPFCEVCEKARRSAAAKTPVEKDAWIEIHLVDQSDNPVPNERYEIQLPDGQVVSGTLDTDGKARVEHIPAGMCSVTFPDLSDYK